MLKACIKILKDHQAAGEVYVAGQVVEEEKVELERST